MPEPTAEAVARDSLRWLRDTWAYDALSKMTLHEDAVSHLAAALTAHATAAVAAERERCAKEADWAAAQAGRYSAHAQGVCEEIAAAIRRAEARRDA